MLDAAGCCWLLLAVLLAPSNGDVFVTPVHAADADGGFGLYGTVRSWVTGGAVPSGESRHVHYMYMDLCPGGLRATWQGMMGRVHVGTCRYILYILVREDGPDDHRRPLISIRRESFCKIS